MPIAFRCPHCSQTLKVPEARAGSKGKCPTCGTVLLIPAAKARAEEAPAPPAVRKKRSSDPAIIEEKALPSRPRAAPEPEEDEPDPDEEVEERPRERRKKKKRKKSPLLLYGLLGGGCAFLLILAGGIGALAWWFFFSTGLDDDLKFMPNNCQVVASIRMDQLLASQVFQELRREIPQIDQGMKAGLNDESGIPTEDIEQIVIGANPNSQDLITVVHTKKAVEARDLRSRIKNSNYTETKIGKYVVHESQNVLHPTFCVVDKKRVVVGKKEVLQAVLQRDKKPEFSKNLQDALKQTDFTKTIAVAADTQVVHALPGGGVPMPGAPNDVLGALGKTKAFSVQCKISSEVRLEMTLFCQDAAAANDVKKLIDGFLVMGRNNKALPKEVSDLLEWNLKVDGTKVSGGNSFKVGPLIQLAKQQKGKF
jgi:hypothetical protein